LKQIIGDVSDKHLKVAAIIKHVPTRWSSFADCILRIIQLWPHLNKFYTEETKLKSKKDSKIVKISQKFDQKTFVMINLLSSLVDKINFYIIEFQSDNLPIVKIPELLKKCVLKVASYIIKGLQKGVSDDDNREQAFSKILPYLNDKTKYEPGDLGPCKNDCFSFEEFTECFKKQEFQLGNDIAALSSTDQVECFEAAYNFLISALEQLKERLPWRDSARDEASVFILSEAFLLLKQIDPIENLKNLHLLANRFKNIITPDEIPAFKQELLKLEANYPKCEKA